MNASDTTHVTLPLSEAVHREETSTDPSAQQQFTLA